jgi:hypothetical protein
MAKYSFLLMGSMKSISPYIKGKCFVQWLQANGTVFRIRKKNGAEEY